MGEHGARRSRGGARATIRTSTRARSRRRSPTTAGGNFENLAIDPATVTTTVDDTIDTTTVELERGLDVAGGRSGYELTYTATLTNAAHGA